MARKKTVQAEADLDAKVNIDELQPLDPEPIEIGDIEKPVRIDDSDPELFKHILARPLGLRSADDDNHAVKTFLFVSQAITAAGTGGATQIDTPQPVVGFSIPDRTYSRIDDLEVDIQPIQSGSGTPAPDNVRPISGRDSVSVTRTGKNLLNLSDEIKIGEQNISYDYKNGGVEATATGTYSMVEFEFTGLIVGKTYTISFNGMSTGNYNRIYLDNSDTGKTFGYGKILTSTMQSYYSTFTAISKRLFIRLYVTSNSSNGTMTVEDLQFELGSTATDYEPYTGTTYPITLPQTVYGGTLDVTRGQLTITHGMIASYNGEPLPGVWISDRDVYAEGTTPTVGAEVVYELEEPIIIRVDPVQISLLEGHNNLWANTGDILRIAYSYENMI